MSVRLVLHRPHTFFTNLDVVSGKVILSLPREESITAIVVKLEGESRTRLATPPGGNRDRSTTEVEVHKVLYKTEVVFPYPDLAKATPNSTYTLSAGSHEFPFHFKIPFNNACSQNTSVLSGVTAARSFAGNSPLGARMEMARVLEHHVKRPLPPSLSGFPGEAEIRYYLKATARRGAFYKENYRTIVDFSFLPLEMPRPPETGREVFARRRHQFQPYTTGPQKSSIFAKRSSGGPSGPPPQISIDGRLPEAAILTCNEPLPLRLILRKLNATTESLFLKLLQVELVGYTKIRAHELSRQESSSWIIISLANLETPLGDLEKPPDTEIEVDSLLWGGIPLPNTVPPTFETCNMTRHYEIEIRIGLAFGTPTNVKPEVTVQSLRLPVQVFSGIKPPADLVAMMSQKPDPLSADQHHTQQKPPPSVSPPSHTAATSGSEPQEATASVPSGEDPNEAPPPSYDDTIAQDLAPVDGPRRDYDQPALQPVVADEKPRRTMSRLFA